MRLTKVYTCITITSFIPVEVLFLRPALIPLEKSRENNQTNKDPFLRKPVMTAKFHFVLLSRTSIYRRDKGLVKYFCSKEVYLCRGSFSYMLLSTERSKSFVKPRTSLHRALLNLGFTVVWQYFSVISLSFKARIGSSHLNRFPSNSSTCNVDDRLTARESSEKTEGERLGREGWCRKRERKKTWIKVWKSFTAEFLLPSLRIKARVAIRSAFQTLVSIHTLVRQLVIKMVTLVTVAVETARDIDTLLLTLHSSHQAFVFIWR